jgi:hypothetical protein
MMISVHCRIPGLLSTSVRRVLFEPCIYSTRVLCGVHQMKGQRSKRHYHRAYRLYRDSDATAGQRIRDRIEYHTMKKMKAWR